MAASAQQESVASGVLAGPNVRRFIAGVLLLAVILFGQQVYGMATANQRLDPSLRGATGPSNVVVVLDFMPERFHNERVSEYGVLSPDATARSTVSACAW